MIHTFVGKYSERIPHKKSQKTHTAWTQLTVCFPELLQVLTFKQVQNNINILFLVFHLFRTKFCFSCFIPTHHIIKILSQNTRQKMETLQSFNHSAGLSLR